MVAITGETIQLYHHPVRLHSDAGHKAADVAGVCGPLARQYLLNRRQVTEGGIVGVQHFAKASHTLGQRQGRRSSASKDRPGKFDDTEGHAATSATSIAEGTLGYNKPRVKSLSCQRRQR